MLASGIVGGGKSRITAEIAGGLVASAGRLLVSSAQQADDGWLAAMALI